MTVTKLARDCGLSRSTILYYESIGLLKPAPRTAGNYRAYAARDAARLRQICVYRNAGLKLADIRAVLDRAESEASSILKRRLVELDAEIARLRGHQLAIVRLLQYKTTIGRNRIMTKDKWVEIMRAAGFTKEAMHRWHVEFEKAAPEDHQSFLEYLNIPADEVGAIRKWSREGAAK
jgi:MerR family transcriptional regulator, thiopeptide resistance regulator